MKNKEIYHLYEGLYEISQDKEIKFDVKIAFALAKNKNLLQPIYDAIIDTRYRLLESCGEPKEDGDWKIPKEKVDEFTKKWKDFMDIDNFITLQHIKLDDIQNKEIGIDLIEKLLPIIDN